MVARVATILKGVVVVLLTAMTTTVALQIVLRYFFASPLPWGEEITRYMFVYLIFLGAAVGIHAGIHVSIDALVVRLPGRARRVMELLAKLIVAAFLVVLVIYGTQLAVNTLGQRSPALGIPIGVAYFAIPLGALFGLLFVFAPKEEHDLEEVLA